MDMAKRNKSQSTKQKPMTTKAGVTGNNNSRRYGCEGKLKK